MGVKPHEVTHLSYSSQSTYLKCGKSYQLGRIQGVKGPPAWWNIGGSAVHAVLDVWDHFSHENGPQGWGAEDIAAAFSVQLDSEIEWAKKQEPDRSKWRIKRRSSEGEAWWKATGPIMCQSYINWRLRSPSWEIWTTPDGEPAIELDISGYLPGCDMEIKAFADRVFRDTMTGGLWVVDFKSGSSMATDLQLGTYSALLVQHYGAQSEANHGATFRVRNNPRGKAPGLYPHDQSLEKWTPRYAGGIYGQMERAVKARVFLPDTSDTGWCTNICDVAHACHAVGGREAEQYDPDHPGNRVPF